MYYLFYLFINGVTEETIVGAAVIENESTPSGQSDSRIQDCSGIKEGSNAMFIYVLFHFQFLMKCFCNNPSLKTS